MLHIPEHKPVALTAITQSGGRIASVTKTRFGTLLLTPVNHSVKRAIMPTREELIAKKKILGKTTKGKDRFVEVHDYQPSSCAIAVRKRTPPELAEKFVAGLTAYKPISPLEWIFEGWSRIDGDDYRYEPENLMWRIGLSSNNDHPFPSEDNVRETCAMIVTEPYELKVRSNHIMLTFETPQSALNIDKLTWLIAQ